MEVERSEYGELLEFVVTVMSRCCTKKSIVDHDELKKVRTLLLISSHNSCWILVVGEMKCVIVVVCCILYHCIPNYTRMNKADKYDCYNFKKCYPNLNPYYLEKNIWDFLLNYSFLSREVIDMWPPSSNFLLFMLFYSLVDFV